MMKLLPWLLASLPLALAGFLRLDFSSSEPECCPLETTLYANAVLTHSGDGSTTLEDAMDDEEDIWIFEPHSSLTPHSTGEWHTAPWGKTDTEIETWVEDIWSTINLPQCIINEGGRSSTRWADAITDFEDSVKERGEQFNHRWWSYHDGFLDWIDDQKVMCRKWEDLYSTTEAISMAEDNYGFAHGTEYTREAWLLRGDIVINDHSSPPKWKVPTEYSIWRTEFNTFRDQFIVDIYACNN